MRLLSIQDLNARGIPFTRQWLHKLVQEGRFPRPVKAGKNRNFWIEAEIDQYLEEIAATVIGAPHDKTRFFKNAAAPKCSCSWK